MPLLRDAPLEHAVSRRRIRSRDRRPRPPSAPSSLPIEPAAALPAAGRRSGRGAGRRYRLRAAAGAAGRNRRRYRRGAGAALSHLLRDHGRAAAAGHAEQQRRDRDGYDQICDHLLVLDHSRGSGADAVVGTYRLIRREAAARIGAFYSAAEYDIAPLRRLSRRNPRTRPLLRRCRLSRPAGHAAVVERHRRLCLPLRHRADVRLRQPAGHRSRTRWPRRSPISTTTIWRRRRCGRGRCPSALSTCAGSTRRRLDPNRMLAALPPLIKGYLRLGGFVGDGAVIDEQFNTTDVCIVVKTDLVAEKYSRHYERQSKDDMGGLDGQPRIASARSALRFWRLGAVSRLDRAADAGAGAGSGAAAALGRDVPALLSSLLLPHSRASGCARSAGRPRPGRCCSPPTTSPISTSRCWARCSPPRSSPRPRSPAGRCSAGWRKLQRSVFVDRRVRSTAQQRDSIAGAARRRRRADPVPRGDERRRQPAPAVQERAVQRRRSCRRPAR